MFKIWSLMLIFTLCLSACSLISPDHQDVLLRDDFSDVESGWDELEDAAGNARYLSGEYQITVNYLQSDIWAYANTPFSDVDITVTAQKASGTDDNNFGIICRAVSDGNFYAGLITSEGLFVVQKLVDGIYERLSGDYFGFSNAIKQGEGVNVIRFTCIGDTMTLYANGEMLASVQDSAFKSGEIGLLAGTFETAGVDIRFDDFIVREP